VRGLSLSQPWASLMAIGAKSIETRSWGTSYRGLVAIHAAQSFPMDAWELCWAKPFADVLFPAGYTAREKFARGQILAVGNLFSCSVISESYIVPNRDRSFGDFSEGRWAWWFSDIERLAEPVPYKGALGLWDIPVATLTWREITRQCQNPVLCSLLDSDGKVTCSS
jgi:activating signal cointegrator 1